MCDLMIFSFSQFLWEITVSGGEVYSKSDILKYVTDNYYHLGTLKYQIDCDALEDHLREDYDEIAWVSCSDSGNKTTYRDQRNFGSQNKAESKEAM